MAEYASTAEHNEIARQWELASHSRLLRAALKHVPLSAMFELTPLCNLSCKMCYIRMNRDERDRLGHELTTEEWVRLARETLELGTLNLMLTGGEVLLRPDFEELYTKLAHMGFLISVNTNATLMTTKVADLFAKYPPSTVSVTLYGASPQTYEAVCGSADGFQKALEGLEMLSKLPTELMVRTTFVKANWHEYPQLREIADRFSGSFAINPFVTKPVRGAVRDLENIRLTAEEVYWVDEENTENYRKQREASCATVGKLTKTELIGEERIKLVSDMIKVLNKVPPTLLHCAAAKTQYAISWDGRMLPCLNFDTPCTFPLDIGMKASWNRLLDLCMEIPACPECQSCEDADYCMNCPGYLQTETGKFDKAAPYLCALAKARKQFYQT